MVFPRRNVLTKELRSSVHGSVYTGRRHPREAVSVRQRYVIQGHELPLEKVRGFRTRHRALAATFSGGAHVDRKPRKPETSGDH